LLLAYNMMAIRWLLCMELSKVEIEIAFSNNSVMAKRRS